MPAEVVERKLTAILAGDVTTYSRLAGLDEDGILSPAEHAVTQTVD